MGKNIEMIKKVMNDLLCEMEEGPEDFDSRLGKKKKPEIDIEVVEMKPMKSGMTEENSDSDEDDDAGKHFDELYARIDEMKRKKRG